MNVHPALLVVDMISAGVLLVIVERQRRTIADLRRRLRGAAEVGS